MAIAKRVLVDAESRGIYRCISHLVHRIYTCRGPTNRYSHYATTFLRLKDIKPNITSDVAIFFSQRIAATEKTIRLN